jgi:ketosteroid isomerase-like protein
VGRLPDDPAAFLAGTERAVNSYDLDAAASVYASQAVMQTVTDGTEEHFEGADAIRAAWNGYFQHMRSTGFRVRKTLVSAEADVLVNNNESSIRDGRSGGGVETWRFDADGRVIEHHIYSFRNARPPSRLIERLMLYPRVALALLKERWR